MDYIPHLRVFISSPGDVNDERQIIMQIIERLPNRPAFREKVAFRVIAWDKPGADTPMRATLTPQEAINAGLPKPSECDIVIVLFWSRMGTPFTMDGQKFQSGTQWELTDALGSSRPETVIYRRNEKREFDVHDEKGRKQYLAVEKFFKSELFYSDEQIIRGVNEYTTPEDFRQKFEMHFEELVVRALDKREKPQIHALDPVRSTAEDFPILKTVIWPVDKSPFPGLRAFTEDDAPIFFGRGVETDTLIKKVRDSRFVAVVGASGSGKSSLVGAGLVPRLRANAISGDKVGSKDWYIVQFTPGQRRNPFESLTEALMNNVPALASDDAIEYPDRMERLTESLMQRPDRLVKTIGQALKQDKRWAEVLVFIDQFEELFTLVDSQYVDPFIQMLATAVNQNELPSRTRVVITIRADFAGYCAEYSTLAELMNSGSYYLPLPTQRALGEMIARPAERAALNFTNGLVDQILNDVGKEPGSLALLAFALDQLHKRTVSHLHEEGSIIEITSADYDAIGGVQGAIGARAEEIFNTLPGTEEQRKERLGQVFQALVAMSEDGTPTRRRAPLSQFGEDEAQLVPAFIRARLLITDEAEGESTIEVAHEALLRSWSRLAAWIAERKDDLWRVQEAERAAAEWERNKWNKDYLWPLNRRLEAVHEALERLGRQPIEALSDFMTCIRLLDQLKRVFGGEGTSRTVLDFVRVGKAGVAVMAQALPLIRYDLDHVYVTMKRYSSEFLPTLKTMLCDDDKDVVLAAVNAMGGLGNAGAVDELLELLAQHKDPDIDKAVVNAFRVMGSRVAEPLLEKLSGDRRVIIRSTAAEVLGKLNNMWAVNGLLRQLAKDENSRVRQAVAEALGKIGDSRAVDGLLERLAKDESLSVLLAVEEALKQIGTPEALLALEKWRDEQRGKED